MDWGSAMKIPSSAEQKSFSMGDTAPYLVCTPDFGKTDKYIEYSVDFRCECQPEATYLAVADWCVVSKQLQEKFYEGMSQR